MIGPACGEEGHDEGEGGDEHLGQRVDNGDLLEHRLRAVERRQERGAQGPQAARKHIIGTGQFSGTVKSAQWNGSRL